eukprot:g22028.t1
MASSISGSQLQVQDGSVGELSLPTVTPSHSPEAIRVAVNFLSLVNYRLMQVVIEYGKLKQTSNNTLGSTQAKLSHGLVQNFVLG